MEALMANLTREISTSIHAFANDIANKYGLDRSELLDLWEKSSGVTTPAIDVQSVVVKSRSKVKAVKAAKAIKTSSPVFPDPDPDQDPEPTEQITAPPSPSSVSSGSTKGCDGCPYILTKGERQGLPCGKKPRKGATYCCRHKKYEGVEPKEKKVLPTVKKSVAGAAKNPARPGATAGVKIVFREHKGCNHHCNPETSMALESIESKIVCGRCDKGVIVPLTAEDIETCKAYGFRYRDNPPKATRVPDPRTPEPDPEYEDPDSPRSEPQAVPKKTTHIRPRDGGSTKRSIANAIATAASETEDVEQILGALQLGVNSDGEAEDVLSEDEDTDDME
jgi:hypothetical protein